MLFDINADFSGTTCPKVLFLARSVKKSKMKTNRIPGEIPELSLGKFVVINFPARLSGEDGQEIVFQIAEEGIGNCVGHYKYPGIHLCEFKITEKVDTERLRDYLVSLVQKSEGITVSVETSGYHARTSRN